MFSDVRHQPSFHDAGVLHELATRLSQIPGLVISEDDVRTKASKRVGPSVLVNEEALKLLEDTLDWIEHTARGSESPGDVVVGPPHNVETSE